MSDYLTRLAETVRPGKLTLQPALPSRFEPVRTGIGPETFSKETDESFTVIDDNARSDTAVARLKPHAAFRQTSSSTADSLAPQGEYEGATTARTTIQATRRIRDPEEPLVETRQLLEQGQPPVPHPIRNGPRGAEDILHVPAMIQRKSAFSVAVESKEVEAAGQSATPVPSIKQEQSVLSQATRQQMQPDNEILHPHTAFDPLPAVQSRTEASEHESAPIGRRVERELQHERKEATSSQPQKPAAPIRGELLPSSSVFRPRTRSADEDAAHDSQLFASPEIHVTIGRIEVRAITSPQGTQRPPPLRAPKISLDNYLRSRNGPVA